jgi:ribosome-binding factor A
LRHALVRILAHGHFRDPILDGAQITVTEVRISPDLRNATAFVVPFAGGDAAELLAALKRAAGFFRNQLAQEVDLRVAPNVRFELDQTLDRAGRVEALLQDPRVARDIAGNKTDGDDGA